MQACWSIALRSSLVGSNLWVSLFFTGCAVWQSWLVIDSSRSLGLRRDEFVPEILDKHPQLCLLITRQGSNISTGTVTINYGFYMILHDFTIFFCRLPGDHRLYRLDGEGGDRWKCGASVGARGAQGPRARAIQINSAFCEAGEYRFGATPRRGGKRQPVLFPRNCCCSHFLLGFFNVPFMSFNLISVQLWLTFQDYQVPLTSLDHHPLDTGKPLPSFYKWSARQPSSSCRGNTSIVRCFVTEFLCFGRVPSNNNRMLSNLKNKSGCFPKIGVPQNGWFIMENPIKMEDLGVPPFSETSESISKNLLEDLSSDFGWLSLVTFYPGCIGHSSRWIYGLLRRQLLGCIPEASQ